MANIFESAFMTLKNGMTMYFADSRARGLIDKLKALVDTKYGPDNPPPSTEGGRIWYATCSTAAGTGAKTATSSTGDFVLQTGAMVRLKCTTANTASNPTISIDGSTAKTIQPKSGTSGMAYRWRAQEVIDLVYDGSNFIMSLGPEADTSFYGITKLSSATNSTAEDVAATPKAVKDAADAKVNKAGDTMTGNLFVTKAGNAYVQAENENTGVKLNLDTGSGINHGIWTYGYYDGGVFYSDPKWMIYRNGSKGIFVNGTSTDDFNLQQGTTIPNNSDLDNYTTPGCYYVLSSTEAATMSHGPITDTGYKLVVMVGSIANRRHQIAFRQSSTSIYMRYRDNSSWGAWELVNTVVERGSSGNWRWVRRNDGTCDLYYQETYTANCSTAKGSIYVQSAQQTLTYPFTVYRGTASVCFYYNSNSYLTWATQVAAFQSQLYYRLACCSSISSIQGTLSAHVAGYWQNPG